MFKRIADIDQLEQCLTCTSMMNRMIMASAARGDYAGYSCLDHRQVDRRSPSSPREPQAAWLPSARTRETDNVKRTQRQADEALDRSVESTGSSSSRPCPRTRENASLLRSKVVWTLRSKVKRTCLGKTVILMWVLRWLTSAHGPRS